MFKLFLRLVLNALAFLLIFPHIPGITFQGTLFQALMLAVLFTIVLWVVDLAAIAISAVFTVSTLGLALLWLIPAWILGFWLLPAVALKLVSDIAPSYLSVSGWTPAVLGGLVLLIVGLVTSASVAEHARRW